MLNTKKLFTKSYIHKKLYLITSTFISCCAIKSEGIFTINYNRKKELSKNKTKGFVKMVQNDIG